MLRLTVAIAVAVTAYAAEPAPFSTSLYPVLKNAGCPACHSADGLASATRLHFPEPSATPAQIDLFGKALVVLVDRENPDNSLLLRKPTNRISHAGGERIKPGTQQDGALKDWVHHLASLTPEEAKLAVTQNAAGLAGSGLHAETVALRRLTHSQYNNTVRDLLSDRSTPASRFPPEDFCWRS
jgi:hypothetical protein